MDKSDPARFLAYNSFSNLNNVFWQLYESMLDDEILGVIPHSGNLITVRVISPDFEVN